MERRTVLFTFKRGDLVRYPTPQGPLYEVRAREYLDGPGRRTYTALPPSPAPAEPYGIYLLSNPYNVLGDLWATDRDMHRATPADHAALASWRLYQTMPTPPWEEAWQVLRTAWGALKALVLRRV